MPLYYGLILGCLAIGGAGFTIRALWTGMSMAGAGPLTAATRSRGMFGLLVFGNLVGIAICLWLAAGYILENFLAPFGLSTYFH